ncbi:hypothetical protein P4U24_14845 [Aeribacillus composti]|uniref:hypothetical protein n=1 Tax=Aeribacillus composti TaxID=1868734 RepID=UPI002E1CD455|nr:hypothetical protein [Aeribacillus composti]
MKLYRACYVDIYDEKDVLVFFAENEEKAFEYICEQNVDDFVQYLIDDTCFGELLEEIEPFYNEAIQYIAKKDFENFARLYWMNIQKQHWTLEEIDVSEEIDVYACYPKDVLEKDDVEIVYIEKDLTDEDEIKELVLIDLAYRESIREPFRDFVTDRAINMSFNERFYCDEKGFIFAEGLPIRLRDDVLEKFGFDESKLSEFWLNNVNEFFEDNDTYRDWYIEYITNKKEPDILDDGFYFYVAKKMLENGEWIEYDIRKVVMKQ